MDAGANDLLSPDQIDQFIQLGYVRIDTAFSQDTAKRCLDAVKQYMRTRKGVDLDNPTTFPKTNTDFANYCLQDLFSLGESPWREILTRKYSNALIQLLGPQMDWNEQTEIGWFPITYPGIDDSSRWKWRTDRGSWHIDGEFVHFADSPEQAILQLVLLTDIGSKQSGTAIIPGSHTSVAKLLHEHRSEGLHSSKLKQIIRQKYSEENFEKGEFQVLDACGSAGTIWLCHPFIVHATGLNVGNSVRVIANPPISFKARMKVYNLGINRNELCPVEQAIRRAFE
jgi:hypothetical protein